MNRLPPVYSGLALQSLSGTWTDTIETESWKLTYLYDEYGRPYAGIYRDPATSTAPVFFGLLTTDRGDVVALLDENGSPFAAYRYDAWGNPMGNVEASEVRYEEDGDLFTYPVPNPWTSASDAQASGGSYVYADETGASVTIQFEGTHLTWITSTSADQGIAKVTLDGGTAVYVDLYSESTLYQQDVWDTDPLDAGTHTLTIEWTGTKNESSTGTSISMDAIDITGVSGTGNVSTGVWAQETRDALEAIVISEALATEIALRQVLRYAGYCYDFESGMYYLSARHYDPATRQFLSKDLSRNDGEQSAYQYCLGNPVGKVDPTGYRPDDPVAFKLWVERQRKAAIARAYAERWRRYSAGLTCNQARVTSGSSTTPSAQIIGSSGERIWPGIPPGFGSGEGWSSGEYKDGTPWLKDPDGHIWRPDPPDGVHWPHYNTDIPGQKRYPRNCFKPDARVPADEKSDQDPWGDDPELSPDSDLWPDPEESPEPEPESKSTLEQMRENFVNNWTAVGEFLQDWWWQYNNEPFFPEGPLRDACPYTL